MSGLTATQNKNRTYTVYKHTCPNGKVYIGITGRNPKERWNYGNGYSNNKHFQNAIKKYGWKNIKHQILFDELTKEEAEQKEIELISFYRSTYEQFGYNIDSGGNCNKSHSNETKRKISNSLIGHEVTNETRIKNSVVLEAFGEKLTIFEWAEKTGIKPQTIWARVNKYGKTAEQALSVKEFRGEKTKRCVVQIDKNGKKINEFESATKAEKETGVCHIGMCCNGKRKTSGGYVWKWFDDYTE